MKLFNFLNKPDYSKLDIPKAENIKGILDEHLTPMLRDAGLATWNGNYQWFGEFNEYGIRPVFQFVRLKGLSGTFAYGNCFKFMPTVSGTNKLLNHRTDKSVCLHLFERTEGWRESFNGSELTDIVSFLNDKDFEKTLIQLRDNYQPKFEDWFSTNRTIPENIITAEKQLKGGSAYRINSPAQNYVLAFLYALNGDIKLSQERVKSYYSSRPDFNKEIEKSISERIKKMQTG
jgi:hypothetical protein